MTDLWPEDLKTLRITPPSSILREQGELLKRKTKGLVEGRVEIARDPQKKDRLIVGFYLVAPSLDDYSYRLVVVDHPVHYYPLVVGYDETQANCRDEGELLSRLKEAFNLESTRRIIGGMMTQAGAEFEANENGHPT